MITLLVAIAAQEPQTGGRSEDVFAGYAGPELVVRETAMLCNGERYVVTQLGRDITQIRTPWGLLPASDLEVVQQETQSVMTYAREIGLLCSPHEFQLALIGDSLGEEPSHPLARIHFWFRDGRLLPEEQGGRSARGPGY